MKHGAAMMSGVVAACLLVACSAAPNARQPAPSRVPTRVRSVTDSGTMQVVRTIPFPASDTELFAAFDSQLYVVVIPQEHVRTISIERVAADSGAVTAVRVPFPLADYLSSIAVSPDGIYLGTSVIKRFTDTPDVLMRLDLTTMMPVAQASFPVAVQVMAQGAGVWVSTGDGRELRLDPKTLAIKAAARLLPVTAAAEGGLLSTPGIGLGSLWVLAGTAPDLQLVRMDRNTLTIRARTPIPTSGALAHLLDGITADASHVYLTGRGVVRVDTTGQLSEPPLIDSGLAAVTLGANGLVALTDVPAIERLSYSGQVESQLALVGASGDLSVSGDYAWLLGDAGQGNGIIQVRLDGQ